MASWRWDWGWRHHYDNRITGCTQNGPDVAAELRNLGIGTGGGGITMTTGLQGVPGKAERRRQAAEYWRWDWGWRHHYDNRITGCTRKG